MDKYERYRKLTSEASSAPLSMLLSELLLFAQEEGHQAVADWVTLELGGYFGGNPALTAEVVVPKYRSVAGQYSDRNGYRLVIPSGDLSFINEYRLRESVAELERIQDHNGSFAIEDPVYLNILRDKLNVNVSQFNFNCSAVSGILGGIRTRLIQQLNEIRPRTSTTVTGDSGSEAAKEPVLEKVGAFAALRLTAHKLDISLQNTLTFVSVFVVPLLATAFGVPLVVALSFGLSIVVWFFVIKSMKNAKSRGSILVVGTLVTATLIGCAVLGNWCRRPSYSPPASSVRPKLALPPVNVTGDCNATNVGDGGSAAANCESGLAKKGK
jgi:AbiTii